MGGRAVGADAAHGDAEAVAAQAVRRPSDDVAVFQFDRGAECFEPCQVQIDAAGAGKLNILGENLAAKSGADVRRFTESGGQPGSDQEAPGFGQLEFAALMRKSCWDSARIRTLL